LLTASHQSAIDDIPEPLRVIGLDASGALDGWPIGVFNEAFDDLVLMREAVRRRLAEDPDPAS
jgi:hypothetical protein